MTRLVCAGLATRDILRVGYGQWRGLTPNIAGYGQWRGLTPNMKGQTPNMKGQTPPVAVSVDGGNHIDGLDLRGVALYAPTEETLRAANTVAALSCRALGGRPAVPTLTELKRRLA